MIPEGFVKYITQYPVLSTLAQSLLTPPEVSVRINRIKAPDCAIPEDQKVGWCPDGMYLSERPQFTFDPRIHQGLYYVQDASSMAITAAIRQEVDSAPVRYLDVCAAPGGKTTAAISALPQGSVVVANEYDFKRAEILAENVAKWGYPAVVISRGDTSRLSKITGAFDIVAVDAPCSGEGMMRKEPAAAEQWSERLVQQCAALQREILANAWEALRPGGILIYSTCAFNRLENEENLLWLVAETGAAPIVIDALETNPEIVHGIDCTLPCYRFLPGKIKGEGLFMAVVRKPGNCAAISFRDKPQKSEQVLGPLKKWLHPGMELSIDKGEVYACPAPDAPFLKAVAQKLDTLVHGVHVATIKGRDFVPTHELALSTALCRGAFPERDIDKEKALAFLHRDNIVLPDGTPKGYVLLTYGGIPLGFVKNLGNRSNNLYPKNWRIRSSYPFLHNKN